MPSDDAAVSPVVGVLLMVSIAVVLSATVLYMANTFADDQPEPAPDLGILRREQAGEADVIRVQEGLMWSDLVLSGSCVPMLNGDPFPTTPGVPVRPGDVLTCGHGEDLTITSDDDHGGAVLLRMQFP